MVGFRERRGRDGLRPRVFKSGLLSGVGASLRPQDVFAANLHTGTSAQQTITTGVDLAGKGGSLLIKSRSATTNNLLFSTLRGSASSLRTNTTDASSPFPDLLQSFSSTGFVAGANGSNLGTNVSGATYVSWSFVQADKFFKVGLFTHTNGTASTIDLSSLGVVGEVWIKSRDIVGDWYAWHRSLTAGSNLRVNTAAAESTVNAHISVSGTTATFAAAAPSANYEIMAWAHDDSADGIIQCGEIVVAASGDPVITLGWRPQHLQIKGKSTANSWFVFDTARGFGAGVDASLSPQGANAESVSTDFGVTTATGFTIPNSSLGPSRTYIYRAIRESSAAPTSWNAADKSTRITLSNNDLTATADGTANFGSVRGTKSRSSGKFYFEIKLTNNPAIGNFYGGLAAATETSLEQPLGNTGHSAGFTSHGQFWISGGVTSTGVSFTTNDVMGVCIDIGAGMMYFRKNGSTITGDPVAGTGGHAVGTGKVWFPAMSGKSAQAATVALSSPSFAYAPPAGYAPWG